MCKRYQIDSISETVSIYLFACSWFRDAYLARITGLLPEKMLSASPQAPFLIEESIESVHSIFERNEK